MKYRKALQNELLDYIIYIQPKQYALNQNNFSVCCFDVLFTDSNVAASATPAHRSHHRKALLLRQFSQWEAAADMSQGYEPEDINPSDKALLLTVLGQVPNFQHDCDITQRPMLTLSWLKHCVCNKSIHNQRMQGTRKAIKEKAQDNFFFHKDHPVLQRVIKQRECTHCHCFLEESLFPPFYSEWFTEISFWLRNNGKWVRAGIVEGEGGRLASRVAGDLSLKLTYHEHT